MDKSSNSVYAIFPNRIAVEQGVEALLESEFRASDISVLFSNRYTSEDYAEEKATKAPEGALGGVVGGAVVGGCLGLLAGIGTITIPEVGPLIAVGPIVGMLAGVATGGAVGGLSGALVGLGIAEYDAVRYQELLKDGAVFLSVHCDDSQWGKKAKAVLMQTEANEIGDKDKERVEFSTQEAPPFVAQGRLANYRFLFNK